MVCRAAKRFLPAVLAGVLAGFAGCESDDRNVDEAFETETRKNRSPDTPTGVKRNPAQPDPEGPSTTE